ncbi:MAG: SDR family oxidoreductase, partial [Gammaproteobacteria bacterium]
RGGNFARTMLRLAQTRDSLSVVADQFGAPTSAELLADVTAHALSTLRLDHSAGGVYHCAAAGETSWFEYAHFVLATAKGLGVELRVQPDQVRPITTNEYPTAACRPLNSRLDTRALCATFGLSLPLWQTGVLRMMHEVVELDGIEPSTSTMPL